MPPAIAAIVLLAINLVVILGVTLLAKSPTYGECEICGNDADVTIGGTRLCTSCATGQDEKA